MALTNDSLHTFVVLAYKESEHLDECVYSLVNQDLTSDIVIATTTFNEHIKCISKKYDLKVIEGFHKNIGGDFEFARKASNSELVTIAHQDDIYDASYSKNIVDAYLRHKDSVIIFSDYYEIRNGNKCVKNSNLRVKSLLLSPVKINILGNRKFLKRLSIMFGNSICCPAVTFVNRNIPFDVFDSEMSSNVDGYAWEKLSRVPGRFTFVNKKLMGHRISDETETTKIINSGIRTNEDLEMFLKFGPSKIANLLCKAYRTAEKSNEAD